jgi:hypothetical protein
MAAESDWRTNLMARCYQVVPCGAHSRRFEALLAEALPRLWGRVKGGSVRVGAGRPGWADVSRSDHTAAKTATASKMMPAAAVTT